MKAIKLTLPEMFQAEIGGGSKSRQSRSNCVGARNTIGDCRDAGAPVGAVVAVDRDNVADAPDTGVVKVTVTPPTGLPDASLRPPQGIGNGASTAAVCGVGNLDRCRGAGGDAETVTPAEATPQRRRPADSPTWLR